MTQKKDVVIVGAARTAIGTFGGSLKDIAAAELATVAIKGAIARAGIEAAQAQQIVVASEEAFTDGAKLAAWAAAAFLLLGFFSTFRLGSRVKKG